MELGPGFPSMYLFLMQPAEACQGHPRIADMLGSEMGARGEDAELGLPLGLWCSHCPHRLSLQVTYILIEEGRPAS
jgi:hypothetical protein